MIAKIILRLLGKKLQKAGILENIELSIVPNQIL